MIRNPILSAFNPDPSIDTLSCRFHNPWVYGAPSVPGVCRTSYVKRRESTPAFSVWRLAYDVRLRSQVKGAA
jgi:beta-xylosidase